MSSTSSFVDRVKGASVCLELLHLSFRFCCHHWFTNITESCCLQPKCCIAAVATTLDIQLCSAILILKTFWVHLISKHFWPAFSNTFSYNFSYLSFYPSFSNFYACPCIFDSVISDFLISNYAAPFSYWYFLKSIICQSFFWPAFYNPFSLGLPYLSFYPKIGLLCIPMYLWFHHQWFFGV